MSIFKNGRVLVALGLLMAASVAWAQTPSAASPRVKVTYMHPEKFTVYRMAPGIERSDVDSNLALLKRYIQTRTAALIGPDQSMSITITDLALAGQYEPWPGAPSGWMRVIRDNYPPRMDLHYTLRDAQGKVIRQGSKKLVGMGVFANPDITDSDPVRYTKVMFNRWLTHTLKGR